MITTWTKHLKTDKEKDAFQKQFHNSSDVLERLAEILKERLTQIEVEEKDFAPGWDNKMAYLVGRRSEIKAILELINLDHRSKK